MIDKLSTILGYNMSDIEFLMNKNYSLIKEDNEYISSFKLKSDQKIDNIPINKPLKPTDEILSKGIKYGMIFTITYKGAKDKHNSGHERVIYPMVFGRSSTGKLLIRGYHLKGWSVSGKKNVEKVWRLFRFDRLKSIIFTGAFYRLPPSGYNMYDKGMRGGIISRADFNEIRRNQQNLLKAKEIENANDIRLEPDENKKIANIQVKYTNTKMDILHPFDNDVISSMKDDKTLKITFLKSEYGNKYYAIIGALGKPGNTVKIKTNKGKYLGVFKVMDSITGDVLNRIKNVKGNTIFDLYIFEKVLR